MSDTHKLVADTLDAVASRDRTRISQVLTEDAVWHTPPSTSPAYRGPHRGLDAIVKLITTAGGNHFVLGSQRAEIQFIVAEGEMAAVQYRRTARTTNGRDYDNIYCFFMRIRHGKVCEVWENLDTAAFYAVLGKTPDWLT